MRIGLTVPATDRGQRCASTPASAMVALVPAVVPPGDAWIELVFQWRLGMRAAIGGTGLGALVAQALGDDFVSPFPGEAQVGATAQQKLAPRAPSMGVADAMDI